MVETGQTLKNTAVQLFRAAGIDTAQLDANVLLQHVLEVDRTRLFLMLEDVVSESLAQRYLQLVHQRADGVPIAYLIGQREFMGLPFITTPNVLVPRPDTEPLVEWGLSWLDAHPGAVVADIGTGSGAIAVSIAYHAKVPHRVIATDVSEAALNIAATNASTLLPSDRHALLSTHLGSLTEPLDARIDLLLTNLPYLTPKQITQNPDLDHEPRLALDGGDDGLDLVRTVIADLPRVLRPDGAVGFEIDPSQSATVQALLASGLPAHTIEVIRDIAGDDRHVVAYTRR